MEEFNYILSQRAIDGVRAHLVNDIMIHNSRKPPEKAPPKTQREWNEALELLRVKLEALDKHRNDPAFWPEWLRVDVSERMRQAAEKLANMLFGGR